MSRLLEKYKNIKFPDPLDSTLVECFIHVCVEKDVAKKYSWYKEDVLDSETWYLERHKEKVKELIPEVKKSIEYAEWLQTILDAIQG